MPLNLLNLDAETRRYMNEEIDFDLAGGSLYLSPRLSSAGVNDYPLLLKTAAAEHDDNWLADQLRHNGRLNAEEPRRTKSGISMVKVPVTAPETMAEGEFNRYYARGLCRKAIAGNIEELEVYRAKQVMQARSESIRKIGTKISAESLLNDLRTHSGMDTALGLPPGPNSGLSVKLP